MCALFSEVPVWQKLREDAGQSQRLSHSNARAGSINTPLQRRREEKSFGLSAGMESPKRISAVAVRCQNLPATGYCPISHCCRFRLKQRCKHSLTWPFRVMQAIQHLAEGQDQSKQDAPLYACFNPYLPDPKDRQEERARLTSKLDAGILAGIYLQMGSDLALLESGLKYLQSQTKQKHTALYGSVFIPSKR